MGYSGARAAGMNRAAGDSKAELRGQVRKEIAALPDSYIADSDNGLFIQVTSMDAFTKARNIMMYCSVEREPDTRAIANAAFSAGKTVAFPFCYRGGEMDARIVRSIDELSPAMLGIPAPPGAAPVIAPGDLDLVLVPALAFDRAGYRLGYGGGYYDRYLIGIPAVTIGLARKLLIRASLPREPHDIAVEYVVTECGIEKHKGE